MEFLAQIKLRIISALFLAGAGLVVYAHFASFKCAQTHPLPKEYVETTNLRIIFTPREQMMLSDSLSYEGEWLLGYRRFGKSYDGVYHSGWTWRWRCFKNHTLMIRGISGSLRISIHSLREAYQDFWSVHGAQSTRPSLDSDLSALGFRARVYDYLAIFSGQERWWTYSQNNAKYSADLWRNMNALHRIYVLTMPMWFVFLVFLILPFIVFILKPIRARQRRRANRCIHCNYDLNALTEPRCPECGAQVPS